MDIRITRQDLCFTLRAAALIMQDDRLLMVKDTQHDSYYTIGGKVHLGEDTQQTILREVKEETGCTLDIDRLVFVQERFFTFQGKNHHEICFYYLMKTNDPLPALLHTDQDFETLHWLKICDLPHMRIVPAFLKNALQPLPQQTRHIICRE